MTVRPAFSNSAVVYPSKTPLTVNAELNSGKERFCVNDDRRNAFMKNTWGETHV